MIGGMIWPLVDAATSIAPALTAGMPMRRMTGIVNVPVVTTLAMDEPEIIPVMPEARIAALAGAAAETPHQGERERQEVPPGPSLVEQGAEQDEQEHEADGDADRDAEDRFPRQPLVADQSVQAEPLVRDDVRHRLAEDRVHEK